MRKMTRIRQKIETDEGFSKNIEKIGKSECKKLK